MSRIGKYETTGHTGMLYSADPDWTTRMVSSVPFVRLWSFRWPSVMLCMYLLWFSLNL
jgi:hypothetical protein